jgi:hypothetical protein
MILITCFKMLQISRLFSNLRKYFSSAKICRICVLIKLFHICEKDVDGLDVIACLYFRHNLAISESNKLFIQK